MENGELISIRLPAGLVARVKAEADVSGRSRSRVIRDTLARAFPVFPGYDPDAAKADFEARIRKVNRKVYGA
jgi:hypothetical protein